MPSTPILSWPSLKERRSTVTRALRGALATALGMGLNAFVAFTLASKAGSWQAAMGVIVLDGLVMLVLVLAGLREAIMDAIPRDLRLATGAGIGLFIALLGLVHAKLVVLGVPEAPVGPGRL